LPAEGKEPVKYIFPTPVRVPKLVDPLFTRTAYVSPEVPLLTYVLVELALLLIVELVADTDVSPVRYMGIIHKELLTKFSPEFRLAQ
jgi:hypothetical protein